MKTDNGREGCDGSELVVTGYTKPVNGTEGKYNMVRRWAAESTALAAVFNKFLACSGVRGGCFYLDEDEI
ncbi:hypothetical protein F0L74_21325 [Chitinophaga agrisoli]|uniref:Uncharacterized protein n=1 Tax=Chitinophaga agrisoli TaxID=2607653 RepID=A0A5B2VKM4_9BACT|nr:hypothetical protein [Chitinophaga agrisoli]KAA2238759.1 hypothetical protein F0L74_21325 [Chitinophaga agrisoli]